MAKMYTKRSPSSSRLLRLVVRKWSSTPVSASTTVPINKAYYRRTSSKPSPPNGVSNLRPHFSSNGDSNPRPDFCSDGISNPRVDFTSDEYSNPRPGFSSDGDFNPRGDFSSNGDSNPRPDFPNPGSDFSSNGVSNPRFDSCSDGDSNPRPDLSSNGDSNPRPDFSSHGVSNTRPDFSSDGVSNLRSHFSSNGDSNPRADFCSNGDSNLNSRPDFSISWWNSMISSCSKNGRLKEAENLFELMPERNAVSWNSLISANAKCGCGRFSLRLFQRMLEEGVTPNEATFVGILDACARLAILGPSKNIHAFAIACRFDLDCVVGTAVVNVYSKCGRLKEARNVFERLPCKDVVSWSAMIAAYAQRDLAKEALDVFDSMEETTEGGGVRPNKVTLISVLDACASSAALRVGKRVNAISMCLGFESDVRIGTALVRMYGACGCAREAELAFWRIPSPNAVSWTTMISVFARIGQPERALELFQKMHPSGVEPDKVTFIAILEAITSLACLEHGKTIDAEIDRCGFGSDLVLCTALIQMYVKCGSLEDARVVFDRMPQRNVVAWTAMITALSFNGCNAEALVVFGDMALREGITPDKIAFVAILDACASLAALEQGKLIHAIMAYVGLPLDVVLGTALFKMYGNCGSLGDARRVFDKTPQRDVVSWTTMIDIYAQNGQAKGALELFRRMDAKPNKVTFGSVLSACSHAGLLDCGRGYFVSMFEDHNIVPAMDHFIGLVDLLGRGGRLGEAEDLIDSMPFEPPFESQALAWTCLLGACKVHVDAERGERAAELSIELDSKNSAPYVLLANLYAVVDRWDDASRVRRAMKDKGVTLAISSDGGPPCLPIGNG